MERKHIKAGSNNMRNRKIENKNGLLLFKKAEEITPDENMEEVNMKQPDNNKVEVKENMDKIVVQEKESSLNKEESAKTKQELIKERLEYLRNEIINERISQEEIMELQSLVKYIEPGDVLLLEWAGVPEFSEENKEASIKLNLKRDRKIGLNKQADEEEYKPTRAEELMESYINGNISWVREQIGNDIKLYNEVLEMIMEYKPDEAKTFMRLMTASLNKQALPKKIEYDVFQFDELSPEQQEKVIENYRDINVNYDVWADFVLGDWKSKLSQLGYDGAEIYWSGFWSQGDGACFEAQVNIPIVAKRLGFSDKLLGEDEQGLISGTIKHSGNYYHSRMTDVDLEYHGENDDVANAISDLENAIKSDIVELGNTIYRDLEKEHTDLSSDDAVAEALKGNEYYFNPKTLKIEAGLNKKAIGEQLQKLADEVVKATYKDVQASIDAGINEDTAITDITQHYLDETYDLNDMNDLSQEAVAEFNALVENGIREHLKKKEAILNKKAKINPNNDFEVYFEYLGENPEKFHDAPMDYFSSEEDEELKDRYKIVRWINGEYLLDFLKKVESDNEVGDDIYIINQDTEEEYFDWSDVREKLLNESEIKSELSIKEASDPSDRPPKDWWDSMYKKVKEGNPSYSEEQVRKTIGDIWYNKLSHGKQKTLRGREGKELKSSLNQQADHEGWKNQATWAIAMYIDNDKEELNSVLEDIKNMDRDEVWEYLTTKIDGIVEMMDTSSTLLTDLINGALNDVAWGELADHYLAKVKDTQQVVNPE